MADSDRLNIANKIIKVQDKLIDSFDEWIRFVKANELNKAKEVKDKANILRIEISVYKKEYEKLNKRSGIILLKN